jgi:hypothetical protein
MLSFGRRIFVSSALVACVFAGTAGDAHAQPSVSSFTGRRLGRTRSGEEVKVTREVGSGFVNPWQAAAAARMTGSEAVLVLGRDAKWHACATSTNAFGGITPADDTDVRALRPLASPKGLAALRKTMNEKAYDALVLGVEEKDIRQQGKTSNREAGFVNVTAGLPYPGMHGAERTKDEDFLARSKTAIELDRDLVVTKDPREAAAALFHESIHLADYELAQRWANAYVASGHQLMQDIRYQQPFVTWLGQQKGLTKEDAQMVSDTVVKLNGSTEARAYIGTFIMAIQAGAPDVAQQMIVTYVKRVGRANGVPLLPEGALRDDLRSDLDNARKTLDAKGKGDFDKAMRAAKEANPKAWIFERGANRRS